MRKFVIIACLIVSGINVAMADQTTTSDLDKFGRWLYRQPNTDLDLCVQYQDSAHATAADSASILAEVQALTIPRRVAEHTVWIRSQQKAAENRQAQLLLQYCQSELDTLAAAVQRIATVSGAAAAENYRREGLKKLIPLTTERAAAAPVAPFQKMVQELASRVEKVERIQTATTDSLHVMQTAFADARDAFNRHVGLRIKEAHQR